MVLNQKADFLSHVNGELEERIEELEKGALEESESLERAREEAQGRADRADAEAEALSQEVGGDMGGDRSGSGSKGYVICSMCFL